MSVDKRHVGHLPLAGHSIQDGCGVELIKNVMIEMGVR